MADSLSLITAQIIFLDPRLALIHIPLTVYPLFVQPLLRLVFGEDHDEDAAQLPWTNRHDFLSVSITPIEVSIICTRDLAERFIHPTKAHLEQIYRDYKGGDDINIDIAEEDYTAIQVDGQGIEAGQRVLELTGPLAMAGISIFFITTYFSDYVLVPSRAKRIVTLALEQRGFVFSKVADAFVSQLSPTLQHSMPHEYHDSFFSNGSYAPQPQQQPQMQEAPSTPPAKDIDELQARTFTKLKTFNIQPRADPKLRLVSCAGSRGLDHQSEDKLKNDLLQVLLATMPRMGTGDSSEGQGLLGIPCQREDSSTPDFSASFLSITITANEPVSVLVEERLLARFGESLLGAKDSADVLIPIIFDLRRLRFDVTGIIGGVASRMALTNKRLGPDLSDVSPSSPEVNGYDDRASIVDISFLSTAKSGTVFVKASQLQRVMHELDEGYREAISHT